VEALFGACRQLARDLSKLLICDCGYVLTKFQGNTRLFAHKTFCKYYFNRIYSYFQKGFCHPFNALRYENERCALDQIEVLKSDNWQFFEIRVKFDQSLLKCSDSKPSIN
jgi:hypothetical protein